MRSTIKRLLLSAAVAVPAVGLIGCSADFDWDDYEHRRVQRVYQQDRVPSSAHLLDQGRGEVSARARGGGVVYLYDADDRQVFWKGRVRNGDHVTIDPEDDIAVINGQPVYRRNLVRDHEHRIYLDHR
jgi:hypothetical protein